MANDATLLERYAASRDAEAFAELMTRYAGLVYGTCLRILGNRTQSEDVAQECFFQLAECSERIRGSLPAWLHCVAVRRSRNYVRGQKRREWREREAATLRASESAGERTTWNDVAPHVDAALEALPEELCDVLARHFMEGKTQPEIAASLGVNQSTVSRRLQRGVKLLRKELRKAGVIAPVAALTALLSANAVHAAPATLTAALGKMAMAGVGGSAAASTGTAAGTAGGTGAAAATATAATGGIGIVKLSLIGLATAAAVTTAVVVTQGGGQEADPPEAAPPVVEPVEEPPVAAKPSLPDVTYAGTVVDIEGNPIAGVLVQSTWSWSESSWSDMTSPVTTTEKETRTDPGGRFSLGPLSGISPKLGSRTLLFLHPNYGVGGVSHDTREHVHFDRLRIVLTDPAEIAGRVTDEEGRPIIGASMSAVLSRAAEFAARPYDKVYRQADNEWEFFLGVTERMAVTTDEAGRFRFRNLPTAARAQINAHHPDYRPAYTWRLGRGRPCPVRTGDEAVELVMRRKHGCRIAGQLTEDGHPFPLKGVPVFAKGVRGSGRKAWTDENGRFEITGLRPGPYVIYAALPFGAPEFPCQPKTGVVATLDALTPEVELERTEPIDVSGRLINTASNEGMPNELVSAALLIDGKRMAMRRVLTDDKGAYLMALPPGHYVFRAEGYDQGEYRTVEKAVEISGDLPPANVDLAGEFRPFVTGRLVDSAGRPVQGTVSHLTSENMTTNREGRFETRSALSSECICFAFDRDQRLGRTFLWKPGQRQLDITLLPVATITGAVEDENGKPVQDADVYLWVTRGTRCTGFAHPPWNIESSPDGRFCIHPVPLGMPLRLSMSRPGQETINREIGREELKPGETLQAGTAILATPEKEYTAMLSGRIVDAEGAPVIGAGMVVHNSTVTTLDASDIHGRFVLRGLPVESHVAVRSWHDVVGGQTSLYEFRGLQTGRDDYVLPMLPPGYEWKDTPAPELQVERWLNSKPLTLKDLRGKVVMLVNNIEPRRINRRFVDRLIEEHKADPFAVIGFHIPQSAMRYKKPKGELEGYFEETPFPVALDVATDDAPFGATHAALGATLEGAVVFIDKRGYLRYLLLCDDPALPDRVDELLREPLDVTAAE